MKIIKYFFVGGVAALVDLSLFFSLTKVLEINYLLAGAITFVVATLVNYYLSIRYVFLSGKKFKKSLEIVLIYIVSGISLILNLFLLFLFHKLLFIEVFTSKIIVTGIMFLFNYSIRKYFIFSK